MKHIKTFNNIAQEGLDLFDKTYQLNTNDDAVGILLRSYDLHDYNINPNLLAVARAGAGVNNIPIEKMTQNGIVVFNTPGANANAVKELVLASLIFSVRPIFESIKWLENLESDNISEDVEANKKQFAGSELEGKTLGVIGLGSIGSMVANDAYRLGMNVIGFDPYVSVNTAWKISRRVQRALNIDEILQNADFVSIHAPLNHATKHLIGEKEIATMKEDAVLLNFSRDGLVDNTSIIKALDENKLKKYVTDFAHADLMHHPKITILPHLGASTQEAEVNCAKMAVRTLRHFLETGNIINSVNFPDIELPLTSPIRFGLIHKNMPKMIGKISNIAGELDINIDNMMNKNSGEYAYTIVDISDVNEENLQQLKTSFKQIDGMIKVRCIMND